MLKPAVAGFLMEKELKYLGETLHHPKRPFVAIVGGAKISGKIDVLEALLPRVDEILVGGAMACTFLVAMGLSVGSSLVETDRVALPDKQRLRDIASEISLASGIIVSLLVVDQHIMKERGDFSLFDNIRDEGIAV